MKKNNIDFSWFKKLNTANISPSINPNLQSLFKDPELTQKEILNFLKESNQKQFEVAELQSKTAEKQFINNNRIDFCFYFYYPNNSRKYSNISNQKKR